MSGSPGLELWRCNVILGSQWTMNCETNAGGAPRVQSAPLGVSLVLELEVLDDLLHVRVHVWVRCPVASDVVTAELVREEDRADVGASHHVDETL